MTQIKLRRDTAANFTSKNPVLGIGEPAYETDTKKLKIGDGTTAYTQLEYFSAGGGGSADITATLPLKIVDGVISLEVDGQTIQIVDGKLHANLDELSNTVNTLSDDVATAFDLINIAQEDIQSNVENITNVQNALTKKENKITPIAPLSLREYIKDTLKGFTYTTDGQSIYQNAIQGSAGIASDYSSLYANPSRSVSTINDLFLSYIDIPFTFGKVYTIGQKKSSESYHAEGSFVLGKTLADGTFIPILWEYSDVRITTSDTYQEGNNHLTFDTINGGSLSFNGGTSQESGISSGWLQLIKTDTGVLYNRSRPSSNYPSDHLQLNINNATAIARLNECDTLRLVPSATDWYAWGGSAASAVPVSQIGMYSYSGTAPGNITWEQLGTNEFQIGTAISHNYLELNLGSGLSVVDGKLHANLDELSNTVNTLSDDVATAFDLINIAQEDIQSNVENITNVQNALADKQDKIVTLTKEAYDALTEKDPNTIYMIEDSGSSTGGDKVTVLSNEYTTISPAPTNEVWYKSPGNGYVVARFMSSTSNQFCQLAVNATGTGTLDDNSIYNQTAFSQGGNNGFTLLLPISSTQYYAINTNFGLGLQWARFIPFITV